MGATVKEMQADLAHVWRALAVGSRQLQFGTLWGRQVATWLMSGESRL